MSKMRVALVHDRLTEHGGAENVLAEFVNEWPQAPVYSSIVDADAIRRPVQSVEGTWLSSAYSAMGKRSHAPLLPFVPRAIRRLPLGKGRFDVVLADHFAFATQSVFATDAPVVAYVHSPARWAWDPEFRAQEAGGRAGQLALSALGRIARENELRAAPQLAHIIANSNAVADRISNWWGLPSTVINPPVNVDRFAPDDRVERDDFFLFAGRLVPYKRPDLAIRAAKRAGARIVVAGSGRFSSTLADIAGPETTFAGAVSHDELVGLFRRCRALVMPGVEDFGIVPVEAMACGTPVLATGRGGALDYVHPAVTGELLSGDTDEEIVTSLSEAYLQFDSSKYDPVTIRRHAEGFAPETFRAKIADIVTTVAAT